MSKASGPRIAIRYCTQCHLLLRAAWMAQELLSTFGTDLGEVSLQPGTGDHRGGHLCGARGGQVGGEGAR
jgi:selenoprotein W-related protein